MQEVENRNLSTIQYSFSCHCISPLLFIFCVLLLSCAKSSITAVITSIGISPIFYCGNTQNIFMLILLKKVFYIILYFMGNSPNEFHLNDKE